MTTKHCVTDGIQLYWLDGDHRAWRACALLNIEQLWQAGQDFGFTHFWVMPGCSIDQEGRDFFQVDAPYDTLITPNDVEQPPAFARVRIGKWRDERGHTVYVGYPRRFNWKGTGPFDILDTINYLESYLAVPVQWSSGHIGRALLHKAYAGKERVIRDASSDLRELPFNEAAFDLVFKRPITSDMEGMYLHHYDKNSAYLSACRGANMGIGDPEHVTGGDIIPGLPGIYRVTWEYPFTGEWMPPIVDPRQEWVTNDVLLFAQQHGYILTIHEAWVFNDYRKVLDPVATTIWEARSVLNPKSGPNPFFAEENAIARKNAYDTCKEIALVFVGGFATGKEKHPDIKGIHPNWWADAVGKARVNMLANLLKYTAQAGAPVLVYSDGVWFASKDSNPRTAVPGILDRAEKLGGFKHVYSFQLTAGDIQAVQGKSEGEIVTYFNDVAASLALADVPVF